MSYRPNLLSDVTLDAGQRLRVGQLTTLLDLKTLNEDDALLWENTGTGATSGWADNKYTLSVTSGQFQIRRSRHYTPYFSGKVEQIEVTFDGFQSQSGVVKRVGYFSSNAVTPYDTDKDGFWIEDTGVTKYLVVSRKGTETLRVAIANWNGDPSIQTYDWSKFTVVMFDFLWLGGAGLRMFVKTDEGFILAHVHAAHTGVATSTFMHSPNQCVRADLRGVSDAGSFRMICAQVSTEGSIEESGKQRSINTGHTSLTLTAIGTTYPIIGLQKKTTHRDRTVKQIGVSAFVDTSDQLLVTLQLNPALSAALTWTDIANSAAQKGIPAGGTTVTTPGTILFSLYLSQNQVIPPNILEKDFLSNLGVTIGDVSDQLILCGTPITATVSAYGAIGYKEY